MCHCVDRAVSTAHDHCARVPDGGCHGACGDGFDLPRLFDDEELMRLALRLEDLLHLRSTLRGVAGSGSSVEHDVEGCIARQRGNEHVTFLCEALPMECAGPL